MRFAFSVAVSLVALSSVTLLASAVNVKSFSEHPDTFFLNDKAVAGITSKNFYQTLQIKTFINSARTPQVVLPFAIGEQTPKKTPGQTMDNRWDVRQYGQFTFAGLYDGINQPYVVNRLRALLIRALIANVGPLLDELDNKFNDAKFSFANSAVVEDYVEFKKRVLLRIANVFEQIDKYNESSTSKSAAAAVVTIVSPNFVIVAQVGNIHVISERHLEVVELTSDQARSSSPDSANFNLKPCTNWLELELCSSTRVFGAPQSKIGDQATHINTPFVKMFKRVYAPMLNDDDVVLGRSTRVDTSLETQVNVPEGGEPGFGYDDVEFLPNGRVAAEALAGWASSAAERSLRAETGAETSEEEPSHSLYDSAGQLVQLGLYAGISESKVDEAIYEENDNALKFLVIATHPVLKNMSAHEVARIVAQNMVKLAYHHTSQSERFSLKPLMAQVIRHLIDESQRLETSVLNKFVGSFFSDASVLFIPLITDPQKYYA